VFLFPLYFGEGQRTSSYWLCLVVLFHDGEATGSNWIENLTSFFSFFSS